VFTSCTARPTLPYQAYCVTNLNIFQLHKQTTCHKAAKYSVNISLSFWGWKLIHVRFDVSTAVTMMIIIFWQMTHKSHTVSPPRRWQSKLIQFENEKGPHVADVLWRYLPQEVRRIRKKHPQSLQLVRFEPSTYCMQFYRVTTTIICLPSDILWRIFWILILFHIFLLSTSDIAWAQVFIWLYLYWHGLSTDCG
jgi:hypothetical protein